MFVIKFVLVSSLFAGGIGATSTQTYQSLAACNAAALAAGGSQQPQGPVYTMSCVSAPAVPAQQ